MTKERCESILKQAEKELTKKEMKEVVAEAKKMTDLTCDAYHHLVKFLLEELNPKTKKDAEIIPAVLGGIVALIVKKLGEFSSTLPKPEIVHGYTTMNVRLEQIREYVDEAIKTNNRNMF